MHQGSGQIQQGVIQQGTVSLEVGSLASQIEIVVLLVALPASRGGLAIAGNMTSAETIETPSTGVTWLLMALSGKSWVRSLSLAIGSSSKVVSSASLSRLESDTFLLTMSRLSGHSGGSLASKTGERRAP